MRPRRIAVLPLPLSLFRGVLFGEERMGILHGVSLGAELVWAGSAWAVLGAGGAVALSAF